ncbi:hypothetical protein [Actinokineospora iranica]|uniref:Uncharacterized protein n=1 Tax=Actinokineospora iranica TaxID=1271860 RepID=A0A1G6Y882_9PSEU|nr:hypothetical protein [Actinokineospora iranica]SDD86203.1 hypothetical protein SAMN05216174_12063 [Actinokineospora iranica]
MTTAVRRLNPLTVEAALRGRRAYRDLLAPEAAEVLRILARRGDPLDQVAELLDVDPHKIAGRLTAARPR